MIAIAVAPGGTAVLGNIEPAVDANVSGIAMLASSPLFAGLAMSRLRR